MPFVSSNSTSDLLSTKLAVPRVRGSMVLRDAILERLDATLDRKLVLLCAPAGFGKTTLASEWVSSRQGLHGISAAWVSLDAGDNDPMRFWRYAITACCAFGSGVGETALSLLSRPPQMPFELSHQYYFESVLTSLINDLAQIEAHCVLVLEDYHFITATETHEAMSFFLEHLPDTFHLMLLTRSDPPLPLARLRAHNDTLELRAVDLRFSTAETLAFLHKALHFPVSEDMAGRLHERTEGWAAGLNLTALALQSRPNLDEREQFLLTLTGGNRHILEYLVHDVLKTQPLRMQEFLLQTSGLSRVSAPLCDTVTGRNDSDLVLEELVKANLFLLPLDSQQQWYRYHALFAEAMHYEARRRLGQEALYSFDMKASLWYEQHNMLDEAIETALSARNMERAANLIEKTLEEPHLEKGGELLTVKRWMEQLPNSIVRERPLLALAYGGALMFSDGPGVGRNPEPAELYVELAEQGFTANGNMTRLGEALALHMLMAWWQGRYKQALSLARRSLASLPESEMMWRPTSLGFIGAEELLSGELIKARQTLMEARMQMSANRHAMRGGLIVLAQLETAQGNLRKATELYDQAMKEALEDTDEPDLVSIWLGHAELSYERNELDLSMQQTTIAQELTTRIHDFIGESRIPVMQAQIMAATGDIKQAIESLQQAAAMLQRPNTQLQRIEAILALARLYAMSGQIAAAQSSLDSLEEHSEEEMFGSHKEQKALINAELLIEHGQTEEALSFLQNLKQQAEEAGRTRSGMQIDVLIALAYKKSGRQQEAIQSLQKAVNQAQKEGHKRIILDYGEPANALLRDLIQSTNNPTVKHYATNLLSKTAPQPNTTNNKAQPTSPSNGETLSLQEQKILRLFIAGLSRQEIADELIVSINTVKTHLRRIYTKLSITSRSEAREIAQKHHLL